MIQRLAVLLLCVLQFFPLPAEAQSDTNGGLAPTQYQGASSQLSRINRLGVPIDPVLGYRNAEEVVLLPLSYDDLPDFIRADVQGILGKCSAGGASIPPINAYSYVSSMIRAQGLSPNYLVDFSAFAKAEESTCGSVCKQGACLLLSYDSHDYGQWRRGQRFFTKEWKTGAIQDPRVKRPITIFEIKSDCAQSGGASADSCPAYYIWTKGGLNTYTPP